MTLYCIETVFWERKYKILIFFKSWNVGEKIPKPHQYSIGYTSSLFTQNHTPENIHDDLQELIARDSSPLAHPMDKDAPYPFFHTSIPTKFGSVLPGGPKKFHPNLDKRLTACPKSSNVKCLSFSTSLPESPGIDNDTPVSLLLYPLLLHTCRHIVTPL